MQPHRLRKSAPFRQCNHIQEVKKSNRYYIKFICFISPQAVSNKLQELFECNQQLFDEIIGELPASADILTRIKVDTY